ncbi:stage II sporulation protein M [Nocardia huaxiensis]|uniref:Stage II sporulation protein M n=1 Tax=Nocardia huaxiensis TaxID=2755382 RepID=A0A7D6ZI35_9NOCA|nr:stage II sporulation protein M [Nocardia huaxiensis]QLY31087.1 stage II sporulation protein M [Nocardia huaxiensis]UFS94613.1 stage II sporulation protein M [Nocardia huaxiensis]
MDLDAYTFVHKRSWDRLDQLSKPGRRLSGVEADELVRLYRLTSQQLARLQARDADPELIAGLSVVLTRARGKVLGAQVDTVSEISRFFTHRFPAAVYRAWPWWVSVAALFLLASAALATWVAESESARKKLGLDTDTDALTRPGGEFETYYYEHPHDAFAAQVWTNNARVAAVALFTGILILPAVFAMVMNALNLGVSAGLMADADRLGAFFGYILPHGMIELTAIFVAGGAGLKLGWTLIDPGRESRPQALARQGRATAVIAIGLALTLLVAGLLEGFVTPSGWPTPVRVGLGGLVELGFLIYVFVRGRQVVLEEQALEALPGGEHMPGYPTGRDPEPVAGGATSKVSATAGI